MPSPWPHRIAILATLNALIVLVSGTLATTSASLAVPVMGNRFISNMAHRTAGLHGGAVLLALMVAFSFLEYRPWPRKLGWALCGGVMLQGLLGTYMPVAPARWHGVMHATLAQLIVAGCAILIVATLDVWNRAPEFIADYGWPSLRSFGISLPALVFLQVLLGAMFRQGAADLMPHILGAMIVSLFIVLVGAFALHQAPTHPIVTPAAKSLMTFTFLQVFLGIAAFTFRSLPTQETNLILSISAAHIATGALTLAASIALGLALRKHTRRKAESSPQPAES